MTLIHRLTRTLDPLHGLPSATRQDFACWYRQIKLPQVRQLAFLTMALYLVYALIEQNVAQVLRVVIGVVDWTCTPVPRLSPVA